MPPTPSQYLRQVSKQALFPESQSSPICSLNVDFLGQARLPTGNAMAERQNVAQGTILFVLADYTEVFAVRSARCQILHEVTPSRQPSTVSEDQVPMAFPWITYKIVFARAIRY